MQPPRSVRIFMIVLILPQWILPPAASLGGVFGEKHHDRGEFLTLKEAAAYVDMIDRRLFAEGTIGVKAPDVWGQNRMTVYRAEYESQMATRVAQFQEVLQAAQNRTDISTLTSATSLGATVAAVQSKRAGPFAAIAPKTFQVNAGVSPTAAVTLPAGSNLSYVGGPSPATSLIPPAPSPASPASPTPADPGNPDFTGLSSQLDAISKRLDTLKTGTLTLPSNVNTFVTKGGNGVGIEPVIGLDQESGYINHLHELRRANAGDDLIDLPGYGLYLLRMPISLMPGPESRKGKGAVVTVEARHELTDDLLQNTFRDVTILDLTYALTLVVNEQIHQNIYDSCHGDPASASEKQLDPRQRQIKSEADRATRKADKISRKVFEADKKAETAFNEAKNADTTTGKAKAADIHREAADGHQKANLIHDDIAKANQEAARLNQLAADAFDRVAIANERAVTTSDNEADRVVYREAVQDCRMNAKAYREAAADHAKLADSNQIAAKFNLEAFHDNQTAAEAGQAAKVVNDANAAAKSHAARRTSEAARQKSDEAKVADPIQPAAEQVRSEIDKASAASNSFKTNSSGKRISPQQQERPPTDSPNNVAGPTPVLLHNLKLILGSIDEPLGGPWSEFIESNQKRFGQPNPADAEIRFRVSDSDRFTLLAQSMTGAQSDPYRHDPSTLSLFQNSILDAYRYMAENARQGCPLFQADRIEQLAELVLRRDYPRLRVQREQFLWELYCHRTNTPRATPPPRPPQSGDSYWSDKVEPMDVLAFALLVQSIIVDRQLKWDIKTMVERRGLSLPDPDGYLFYEFEPALEAKSAFREYVACKWPLRIYSVDPVLDQQNVLDAYSRRTELQLALAVSVATGQFNIKNATTFARQLDLDLQTVGLNRTAVGFGAGETTFGWMFYPRVQTPEPVSNFRTFTNLLTGTGQGINADLRSRRIEPGQRECVALMVTPNFIPALKISTVANWFDITGHHAKQRLSNQEMVELGGMLQQAKAAVAHACDSGEYRPTDYVVLNQRIKQLEALLPTQDTRVILPDEGDLLGSEIFSSNASGLSPSLLAWYGEPVQEGTAGLIFLMGRGFSVSETQVVVGGMPLVKDKDFRLISRNVMQVIVPASARAVKVNLADHDEAAAKKPKKAVAALKLPSGQAFTANGEKAKIQGSSRSKAHAELDSKLNSDVDVTIHDGLGSTATGQGAKVEVALGDITATVEAGAKPTTLPCDRSVIDVHVATPNGISNHLYVEAQAQPKAAKLDAAVTTATTLSPATRSSTPTVAPAATATTDEAPISPTKDASPPTIEPIPSAPEDSTSSSPTPLPELPPIASASLPETAPVAFGKPRFSMGAGMFRGVGGITDSKVGTASFSKPKTAPIPLPTSPKATELKPSASDRGSQPVKREKPSLLQRIGIR